MDRFFCIYRRIVRLFALLCLLFALFHRKGEDTPELFVPFPDESDIFLKKAGQNREKPLEISSKIVYNL